MKTQILKIEKKHLQGAKYVDNEDCPIARALKDRGYQGVSVGGTYARFMKNGKRLEIDFILSGHDIRRKIENGIRFQKPFGIKILVPETL